MYKIKQFSRQKGFTLIELLIFASITVVATVVAYHIYDKNNVSKKVSNELRSFSQFVEGLDKITLASDFSTINNSTLDQFNLNFKSEFQQPIVSNSGPTQLTVRYNNLGKEVCSDFTSKAINQVTSINNFTTQVNSQVMKNDPGLIAVNCSGENNTVEFVFNKLAPSIVAVAQSPVPTPTVEPRPYFPTPTPVVIPPITSPSFPTPTMPTFPGTGITRPTIPGINNPSTPPVVVTPTNPSVPPYIPPVINPVNPNPPDISPGPGSKPTPPEYLSKSVFFCRRGYTENNDCDSPSRYMTIYLYIHSNNPSYGTISVSFPSGEQVCNTGEPGLDTYGGYYNPNNPTMTISNFKSIQGFAFTCAQNG